MLLKGSFIPTSNTKIRSMYEYQNTEISILKHPDVIENTDACV